MENILKIKGGKRLTGEVNISSSKNAAVAILPAVVLGSEIVKLYDVPHIEDVHVLIQLLQELNINVTTDRNNALVIDPTDMNNIVLCSENVSRLRASYYFMGALLSRYRYVKMLYPGGCNLGPRPIDLHLKGFEALGAKVTNDKNKYIGQVHDNQLFHIFGGQFTFQLISQLIKEGVYRK